MRWPRRETSHCSSRTSAVSEGHLLDGQVSCSDPLLTARLAPNGLAAVEVDDRFFEETPFNHYDLLFGRNVATLVNLPSLKLIESYDT